MTHTEETNRAATIRRMEIFLAQVKQSMPPSTPEQNGDSVRNQEKSSHTMLRLLVLNGPNLNLLGSRETGIYGEMTLAGIESLCRKQVQGRGVDLDFFQSNHEGVLVERIQQAQSLIDLIIINPAAYTHTSVAIRDALLAVNIPVIEVHLSNIYKREPFRHHSYIRDIAIGNIVGFGPEGYSFAIEAGIRYLSQEKLSDAKKVTRHG